MAWRLAQSVVRGEIDNRTRDRVSGTLWLLGRKKPVRLALSGNCLRDVAGCRLTFENPAPEGGDHVDLADLQEGVVGDITASRKVRAFAVPVEEALELRREGKPVKEFLCNALYLEWFSEANGRVVVESADFRMSLSEPEWSMSEDQEIDQCRANLQAIRDWMDRFAESRSAARPVAPADPRPMSEFEWEKSLKESDKLTEKYSQLLDKYLEHPDRDRIIAREMGWTWLEDALDAAKRGAFSEESEDEEGEDALDPMVPNPMTEGVDWIRTDSGRITHPLAARAFDLAMGIWQYCTDRNLLEDHADRDLHDMLFQAQALSAKLAGALDGLAYDEEVEGGFVVACLKRTLRAFDSAMKSCDRVAEKNLLEPGRLKSFREELFSIREETLRLMKRFRPK